MTRGLVLLPQRTRNVPVSGGAEILLRPAVQEAIAAAEAGGVRMVVRASGTEPVIRILAEGEEGRAQEAADSVERAVLSEREAL